ncbi:DNA repair protein RecN [Acidaminobacterium chupaoyuni]
MLKTLHIENVAIIEKTDIEFQNGFTVMTGETGAGKSIMIDALYAVLGARTSRDLIRHGEKKALILAQFCALSAEAAQCAASYGYPCDENGELLLFREFSADGRSSCRINGKPVSVSILKAIGANLITIHGQNDGMRLLDENAHIDYLDNFGDYQTIMDQYYKAYQQLLQMSKELKKTLTKKEELSKKADFLTFQKQELESSKLRRGEMEELLARRAQLAHAEKITSAIAQARLVFAGNDETAGILGLLKSGEDALLSVKNFQQQCGDYALRTGELLTLAGDLEQDLFSLSESMEFSQQEQEEVEQRLDLLTRLTQKYHTDEDGLLKLFDEVSEELEHFNHAENDIEELQTAYSQKRNEVQRLSSSLHQARHETGLRLEKAIEDQLRQLDMPHAKFHVAIASTAAEGHIKFTRRGTDQVAFLLTTNPGEELKPLSKIASGGELSRIMLAIKSILAQSDPIDTLIFDEIDTGVSGHAANRVGEKLFMLALHKQVLCVTHLPQIAALGEHQYLIEKQVSGGKTTTEIQLLLLDGRIREIARMTAGMNITEQTLNNASEILHIAKEFQEKQRESMGIPIDLNGKSC